MNEYLSIEHKRSVHVSFQVQGEERDSWALGLTLTRGYNTVE